MRKLELPISRTINGVAFSPDGQTLAVCGQTGLYLVDPYSGQIRHHHISGQFHDVYFSADGTWLLTVGSSLLLLSTSDPLKTFVWNGSGTRVIASYQDQDQNRLTYLNNNRIVDLTLPNDVLNFVEYFSNYAQVRTWSQNIRGNTIWEQNLEPIGLDSQRGVLVREWSTRQQKIHVVLFDSRDLNRIAYLDGMEFGTESGHKHSGDWFAVCTRQEMVIYNRTDLSNLPSSGPPGAKPRGILRTLVENIFGAPATMEPQFSSLPKLLPRLRIPAVGLPPSYTLPFAFMPDGQSFLCKGKQSNIDLRETETGQVRTTWQFTKAWPRLLAVATDGLTAVCANRGGTLVVWDLE
jgi:WD40 repeat protein